MQRKLSKDDLLKKAINELYQNQAAFHASMQQFCAAFTEDICALLKEKDRQKLDHFLKPYQQLTANPFVSSAHTEPTLENIAEIISEANNDFNKVWNALSVCNDQFSAFNAFLVSLDKRNSKFTNSLQENLCKTSNTALALGAYTVKPVQHSMRYILTFYEVNKYTDDIIVGDTVSLLENSTRRVNYYMYTKEIISELKDLREKKNSRRTANPVVAYIDSILKADPLQASATLSREDSRLQFINVLRFLHKRLVTLSFLASDFGSLTIFKHSHNLFLKTLQGLTKKVEQRYLEEVTHLSSMRKLTN